MIGDVWNKLHQPNEKAHQEMMPSFPVINPTGFTPGRLGGFLGNSSHKLRQQFRVDLPNLVNTFLHSSATFDDLYAYCLIFLPDFLRCQYLSKEF